MNEAHECSGWSGYLFGHQMEPRYDRREKEPEWVKIMIDRANTLRFDYPPYLVTRTYVCDICERCGYTVRREAA